MATPNKSITTLVQEAKELFKDTYEADPDIAASAPGRVNLIGEHTDYNGGFVFPMALQMVTVIVGKKNTLSVCRIRSGIMKSDIVEIPTKPKPGSLPTEQSWASYIAGVIGNFHEEGVGFDCVIITSVPLGGGLSSSASLEVAMYTFLESLNQSKCPSLNEKALRCQKAEHTFAGVPCGIMDQFISTFAQEGHALLLDCKSLQTTLIPLEDDSIAFLIVNSNVKHSLSTSEYPVRRQHCHEAARILQKEDLRDVSLEYFEANKSQLNDVMAKRAYHVITEIDRTLRAAEALKKADYVAFGALMTASHKSLRDDFEVSCPELNELVDLALQVDGVYGSRMTGGGFGGCTVTLVKKEKLNDVMEKIKNEYKGTPSFYVSKPSAGAQILTI